MVQVRLGPRSYRVVIERGLLRRVGARLKRVLSVSEVYVVSSTPVMRLHGPTLRASCRRAGLAIRWLPVPDGERAKTLAVAEMALRRLARFGAGRDAALVAFGGGSVGDLAGFVAAVYMRGIRFVQIPTTVIAQVDAAIGGKTAVDLFEGKNLVGAFHQPTVVLSDPEVLRTLPRRQLLAGLAEVVKRGAIASPALFVWLEKHALQVRRGEIGALQMVVEINSRIKAAIVARDERESGQRMILNFGHTLGHALEAAGRYRRLLHGEAVSIGMVCATRLSVRLGLCAPSVAFRVEALLRKLGLPVRIPAGLPQERIVRAMGLDKKRRHGRLRVVLTRKIGDVTVIDNVSSEAVLRASIL